MSKVLVTGGAGFIGAHLVRALLQRGDTVRVVDNLVTGTAEKLSLAIAVPLSIVRVAVTEAQGRLVSLTDRCDILIGDIRDPGVMAKACEGVEIVFHQAALRSVPLSIVDPQGAHEVNATGTLRVLQAARNAQVKRIVFASSSSVYGDTKVPMHEEQVPQPKSPYAASKLAGEAYCQAYGRVFGLSTIALRYFNVFGPWQDPASEYAAVIPKFIMQAIRGDLLSVHGDGRQSRDFTYVDNVVDANLAAADAKVANLALNIGAGARFTLLQFIEHIGRILGRRIEYVHEPPRPGDVRHTEADISLARRLIGYRPGIDFETGLRHTIEALHQTVGISQDRG